MELRHLRYFTAVAEERTFIAAAKRLGVAQPALTRQIQALEQELTAALLDRGPRGVTLTPAGEVVFSSARHVLRQVDAAVDRARGAGRGVAGRCVVCFGARSLVSGMLGRIVVRLNERYPDIELVVTEGVGTRQFRAIQLGEADIGVGIPAPPSFPDLASETVDYDVLDAACVPESHRLAGRSSVDLSELASETFITWSVTAVSGIRAMIDNAFREVGFTPAVEREYDHLLGVGAAVTAGQGWTLTYGATPALAPRGTAIIPLNDFALPFPHAVVWRAHEERPVVRTVLAVIRQVMGEDRRMRHALPPSRPTPTLPLPAMSGQPTMAASSVLELRHLRYFCSVVEAGSFGRAADVLELTQPALSRQVGDLERIAGTALLERAARGTSPSPAGRSLYRSARRILDEVNAIASETQRAQRGAIARCHIAAVPTPAARALLSTLVRTCAAEMPHLELALDSFTTPQQPTQLRDGHIDLGICHASPMSPVEERGIERIHLSTDLMSCALVSAKNPLSSRTRLQFRDLSDVPFLFPERSFQPLLYDQLFQVFEEHGVRPNIEASYEGLQTMWALVAEDRGWTVGFASQCDEPPPGTVAIPIEHFAVPWGLDLLMREDESRSSILAVADRLREIAHERSVD